MGFVIDFTLKRKPNYVKRKAIIPVIILAVLSTLSHMLPVESGERIGLSMTSILTMIIALQYASDHLPESDEEPLVVFFGRITLFAMITSLFLTILILNLYHKKRKPMGEKSKGLLSKICRIFWIKFRETDLVSDIESKGDCKGAANNEWIALALLIDRISILSSIALTVTLISSIK